MLGISSLTHDLLGEVQVAHYEDGVVQGSIRPVVGLVPVHLVVLLE